MRKAKLQFYCYHGIANKVKASLFAFLKRIFKKTYMCLILYQVSLHAVIVTLRATMLHIE